MNVWWEPQMIEHRLSDGSLAVYNKGFILKGVLSWGSDGWIDSDEYSNVAVMYNQLTATAKFSPKPDSFPTRIFNVQLRGSFNFVPHDGHLQTHNQLFQGTIEFESSIGDIVATATALL